MHRFSAWVALLSCLVCASWTASALAVQPSDRVLPNSTKGYLSVVNVDDLMKSWDQTQLGQLMQDPVMRPFADDLREQLKEQFASKVDNLGITIDDLKEVAGGEVAGGLIHMRTGEPCIVLLVDVTGREEKLTDLLKRIDAKLLEQKAKSSQKTVENVSVKIYDLPDPPADSVDPPRVIRQAIVAVKDSQLFVTTRLDAMADILRRTGDEQGDSLAQLANYQTVMARCANEAKDLAPQVRWYIDPLAFAEDIQALSPPPNPDESRGETTDMIKVARNQGFGAIQAIGGFVNFAVGKYDILHRTSVYAPPPYEKAMRMLKFPNTDDLSPPAWIPADVASYTTFNWDMKNAFESASTLFDEVIGQGEEGVFEQTLDSLREDPNGPGIDVRKDLVAYIGDRATVVLDYQLPITPTSERMLIAAETTNEAKMADSIARSLADDPTVTKREFQNFVIWEVADEEETLTAPTVEIEGAVPLEDDLRPKRKKSPDESSEEEMLEDARLLPSSAITVAYGHVFLATHVDFLEKILAHAAEHQQLAEDVDYQQVSAEMTNLGASQAAMKMFRRTEDEWRGTYELMREGKMPESETIMGRLLNRILTVEEGEVRQPKFDASKLPDYQVVRRYLGPAGIFAVSVEDGWFVTGFTLNRDVQQPPATASK